jgi:hypothetical protein
MGARSALVPVKEIWMDTRQGRTVEHFWRSVIQRTPYVYRLVGRIFRSSQRHRGSILPVPQPRPAAHRGTGTVGYWYLVLVPHRRARRQFLNSFLLINNLPPAPALSYERGKEDNNGVRIRLTDFPRLVIARLTRRTN